MVLTSFGLDLRWLVGLGADGCSTMLGEKGGVALKLCAPKSDTSQGRINNASDYYRFHTKASCAHSDGHSLIHCIFTSLIDRHSLRCCIFTSLIDRHSLRHCISISSIDCHSLRHCVFISSTDRHSLRHCVFISSTDRHSLRHCVFSSFIDRYV